MLRRKKGTEERKNKLCKLENMDIIMEYDIYKIFLIIVLKNNK